MSLTERILVRLFNNFIRRTCLMATLTEISAMVDEVLASVTTIDTELDAVATMIAGLKAGQVSQADIDALASKVETLKVRSSAVVAETEALKA